jgi:2,3-bisphosphoglycerate-independent phosphoglycerate mutase
LDAAIIAMEVVDECVGKLVDVVTEMNGIAVITADHGNLDEMYKEKKGKKEVVTAHTLNPVPFVICAPQYRDLFSLSDIASPGLVNVAATLCNLLGFEAPEKYEQSIINSPNIDI